MTPNIKPFLEAAINANRQRWDENTYESCRDILTDTLRRAGADWQFVGKTGDMDGDSVQPPGFTPFNIELTRPDGQRQTVRIVGTSHDAAWHVPSGRQVKVIVNSAANSDSRPHIHGPAQIGGDVIPAEHYRWHNPPVAQNGDVQPSPTPQPPDPQPPSGMPGYEELGGDPYWWSAIGTPLQEDMEKATAAHGGGPLNAGSSVWFSRPIFRILHAYASGQVPDRPAIIKSVRNEWRAILTAQGATGLPQLP